MKRQHEMIMNMIFFSFFSISVKAPKTQVISDHSVEIPPSLSDYTADSDFIIWCQSVSPLAAK